MSSSTQKNTGYLEIILGPMYSGKTSRLVEIYKQCMFCNLSVVAINYSLDQRYDLHLLSTHDQIKIPCVQTELLSDILLEENVRKAEVVLINEGQFFDDLYSTIKTMLSMKKQIYIAGLDGDFERKKFGQILDLIPLCDRVTKLTSLCSKCKNGKQAIFSLRLTSEKEQLLIGSDNYIPVCRNCYENNEDKNKQYTFG
jgi:thymidine kinase